MGSIASSPVWQYLQLSKIYSLPCSGKRDVKQSLVGFFFPDNWSVFE